MTTPRIALRMDRTNSKRLDDIVVTDVAMFRAEHMGDGRWWVRCYLPNDDAIDFSCRGPWEVTEMPGQEYEDFDMKVVGG